MRGEHAQEGVAWCATTADYDKDKMWGHCGIPPSESHGIKISQL